jgi:uncharacterized protein
VIRGLALITGASSGIGKAFAQRLAADGYNLILVARRGERLDELAANLSAGSVQNIVADLSTDEGIEAVAARCAAEPLTMLVNNAGVAHYMPLADLPVEKARELTHVKTMAPLLLTRNALPGMLERSNGTIVNVAGMLAFSGAAPPAPSAGQRAAYVGSLAGTLAFTQTLSAELAGSGVTAHVVCPGIVATEFHTVQGMDLSGLPRMSAADVVTGTLAGIGLGEVVIAPGVEDSTLLHAASAAGLAAFEGQTPRLASRYVSG